MVGNILRSSLLFLAMPSVPALPPLYWMRFGANGLTTAVAGVGEASEMKGDAQFLLWVFIGSFLFMVIACGLLMYPITIVLFDFYPQLPQSLSNTDITEIPFASWLPSSAVLLEGYVRDGGSDDATYVYKVTIDRSDLEGLMQHTPDWDDEWLEQLRWTWMSDGLVRTWLESSGAKKCYSYSADSSTRDGFDIITVCLDDSDVSTIYIEEHPAYQTGGW